MTDERAGFAVVMSTLNVIVGVDRERGLRGEAAPKPW